MSSTSQPGSAKAGSEVSGVASEQEIPKEVLDRVPREVHEEMAEVADGYGEQLLKLEASPDALKALQVMKDTMKELGVCSPAEFL